MSLGCTAKGRHVLSLKRRWFLLLFWSSADYHFWSLMNDCFYLVLWKGTIYCSFERVLLTQLRICTSASVKSAKTRLCQRSGLSHCFSEGFPGARSVVGLLSKSWRWRRCSCSKTSASVGFLSVSATGFGSQPNPRFNADVARLSFSSNGRSSL